MSRYVQTVHLVSNWCRIFAMIISLGIFITYLGKCSTISVKKKQKKTALYNSCNMGMRALPDMYARLHKGLHIRQSLNSHVQLIII